MELAASSPAARQGSEGRPARVRSGADGRSFRVRSRSTNDPRYLPKQPLSRRALDRRRQDLVFGFIAALGGPEAVNDLALLQVRRCAELQAMCEAARANALNGAQVDMLALVRLEGIAARSLRLLGIKVEQPPARARGLELSRLRWAEAERRSQSDQKAVAKRPETAESESADTLAHTTEPELPDDSRAA
jgi:hypothetical protein